MSRVLEPAVYVKWLDGFLPAAHSADFKPLRAISFDATGRGRGAGRATEPPATPESRGAGAPPAGATPAGRGSATTPRATWIGLAFTRADHLARIAAALPATDPRVAVFRRLADIHAANGLRELTNPAAFDAPWTNALAVSYLITAGGSR